MEQNPCEHSFTFLRSKKLSDHNGVSYNTQFIRIDYFFCTKCLQYKEVKQETWSRDTPSWY